MQLCGWGKNVNGSREVIARSFTCRRWSIVAGRRKPPNADPMAGKHVPNPNFGGKDPTEEYQSLDDGEKSEDIH